MESFSGSVPLRYQKYMSFVEPETKVLFFEPPSYRLLSYLSQELKIKVFVVSKNLKNKVFLQRFGIAYAEKDIHEFCDLNHGGIKFDTVFVDNSFLTSNNLEKTMKKINRIGNYIVYTVPNYLNFMSRLKFLISGNMSIFYNRGRVWYDNSLPKICGYEDFLKLCYRSGSFVYGSFFIDKYGKTYDMSKSMLFSSFRAKEFFFLVGK